MKHLTDAQFTECLTAAQAEPAIHAHLAECDACRMELGSFLAAMDDFGTAAMDWSKAQPAPGVRAKLTRSQPGFAGPLRWAVAAVLIAAVGVPVALHRDHEMDVPGGAATKAVDAVDSAAQIAQDNRLLESVNVVLSESDPSPLMEYELDDSTRSGLRMTAKARVE